MIACCSDSTADPKARLVPAWQALKEEELVRLLTEPRGALCKQYLLQFDLNDAGFVMTEVRYHPLFCQCHWAECYSNSRLSSALSAVDRCDATSAAGLISCLRSFACYRPRTASWRPPRCAAAPAPAACARCWTACSVMRCTTCVAPPPDFHP